jgi:hydrogenase-4 transcriptional activator
MRSTDLLGLYVRGLCSLLGARVVSVYVPASPVGPDLAHDGPLEPVPELSDLSQAARFLEDIEREVWKLRGVRPGLAGIEAPSRAGDGRLIGIFSGLPTRLPDRRQPRSVPDASDGLPPHGPELWLGLRLEDDAERTPLVRLPPRPDAVRALEAPWAWLLGFAGVLARHSRRVSQILDDPVTGLPARAEFQVDLERAVDAALEDERPLTLLMINPNDFNALNDRMSREDADQVVREIADRLRACHRRSDQVARYGSVVFTSILGGADRAEGLRRATEILEQLHGREYFRGTVRLRFSLGVASFEPGDREVRGALDLIRRADTALGIAKRNGGGMGTWQPGEDEETGYHDRLTGIFTGRLAKDYRNMAVLSDTISVLAVASKPEDLAADVVRGLYAAMKPERVGLFDWPDDKPRLRAGLTRSGSPVPTLAIDDTEREQIAIARARRRTVEAHIGTGADEMLKLSIPLLAGEDCLGVLYLAGHVRSTSFDASDLVFLEALATQVALALDRARLTEHQRQREEQERQRLLAEVAELRNALHRTQIIYRSRPMEALLDKARRVAPTDATVLVTGESGTGKELFARAIHQLSPRRDQPFVVVDCGAIPTTLLESELFGHEKGAFTGAQARQLGRLVQADRGTLLLDEIGELPLEAQSRFLRFVQEKYVSPVGGRTGRTVDVRVIAATNRDLQDEVAAGRFRADFYHRLNVVRLEIPPLRERMDDVLHLAHHFCTMYALMYGRPVLSFSPEAEAAVLSHPWPGNVRELQNRVMRAMILAQGQALTPADLGFSDGVSADALAPVALAIEAEPEPEPDEPLPTIASSDATPDEAWPNLREALGRQVEQALSGRQPLAPLGRWLADDLVLEADRLGRGVARSAAAILGMPVTTFRRRLASSQAQAGAGWAPRPGAWPVVRERLADVLRSGDSSRNVLKDVLQVLHEEVSAQAPSDPRVGAALLGVTLPTFRRRRGGSPQPD